MKFYCIVRNINDIQNPDTYSLLEKAATSRGVEFIPLEADFVAYHNLDGLVERDSLLYRLAGGAMPARLEALLSDRTVTLKKDASAVLARGSMWGSAIRLMHAGLPIIPTVFSVTGGDRAVIDDYVNYLGGIPVVLKAAGGSHGDGVMKYDDLDSLYATLSTFSKVELRDVVLRRFIPNARHLRLVVLGDRVLDTIEYQPQPNDFRTNAVAEPQVHGVNDAPEDIIADAVESVRVQGLEFGGVDILVADDGKHYIAEVNFPCNFARNQLNTGADIAGEMLDYLIAKRAGGLGL